MFSNILSIYSRYRRRLLYPLISILLSLTLVVGTAQVAQGVPWLELLLRGIQIIQLSNMSDQQEVQIGQQINQQLVGKQFKLYRNREINRYVDQIGQRLAKSSERPNINYTFQVVDDANINAFATMGGFVYINTGLIAAADNEAQLASVMAHEIGHIVGRHSIQQIKQAAIARGLAEAAGVDSNTMVNLGVELALRRPNSRQHEFEADQLGIKNLKQAGYAPIGSVDFMKKLLKQRGFIPGFLSTHPSTADRIDSLEQSIDSNRAYVGDGLNNRAYKNKTRVVVRNQKKAALKRTTGRGGRVLR
ncbi:MULTISPECIES: M48 family metallopeptidase [unclassified Moorena]|uniref:M48 family metallopeptidase n=1 Tax=unclassified Moorena TaxID=2683338 RepID=UPI0013FE71B9|nr:MULTISPECIES: M48 family metallopeptidase [unclassified Moorena]NEO12677.1 M48 family metalloprotease [Moorena sp. SIO3E8]NEP97611.1 M48 family metalloprotease [Moorena sp. SIO3F7]